MLVIYRNAPVEES